MKKLLPVILLMLLFTCTRTSAQVAAIPFTSALDTFSVITGTTVDAPNVDDISYRGIPIGFTFNFGGVNHDYMSINTNGYIQLDSNGTGSFFSILSGSQNNVIAPFGADLINRRAGASIQYTTIGTAPNRITIVQWLHYSYFGNSGDVSFQLWLQEGSNCIRFIYGNNTYTSTALNTQIGMRGTNNLDFLVLGDSTCNWANAYPYPSITTSFPVRTSCTMPSGFAFHWGACGSSGTNFYYMTGTVFNDLNGNGVRDTNEAGIANHMINLMPGNYYASTDAAGDYTFFYTDSTITYTLSTSANLYWANTTPLTISCTPQSQPTNGLDFGMQLIPGVHEVAVHCPNWGARPGFLEPMPISYVNNGTSVESDTITFVMDSLYSFVNSTPPPTVQNGQTLQWAYSNLAPGQHGSIMLHLMPSLSAVLGDTLYSTLTIGPLNDTLPTNNVVNLHQLVSLAWDPNEKDASPSGDIDAGTDILYTIHFQNTGNDTAFNVVILDTIDAGLDLLSFRLLGSSHNVNLTTEGSGILRFTFYNIMLPDSGRDQAGSNGYVSYAIRARSNLSPGSSIANTAGIIFDFNPAIITNTTLNTIRIVESIAGITSGTGLKVWPNPASQQVLFSFSENKGERAMLSITSLEGKTVMVKNNVTSSDPVFVGSLPAGIYICTLTMEKQTMTVKIVKE